MALEFGLHCLLKLCFSKQCSSHFQCDCRIEREHQYMGLRKGEGMGFVGPK